MNNADVLLAGMLATAVPLWIERLRQYTDEQRRKIGRQDGDYIAEHGDNVLYRGHKPGDSAEAFNRVARGLAVGAYQPGGVTAFGQHWCTDHGECEAADG